MKILILALLTICSTPTVEWQTDFTTAMHLAKEKNQLILLNFSGSDWCIPCIRMHKEIFDSPGFDETAGSKLVLYNADFPRKKKNALSEGTSIQNKALAEKYNPEGRFPYTVLLNPSGAMIKVWDGYPEEGLEKFLSAIKKLNDDYTP